MEEKANVETDPVETEHPVAKALREELTTLLQGPLTVKLLNRINRLTEAGCSTLEALEAAGPRRRRRGLGQYLNPVYGGGDDADDNFAGVSTNGETYGATVARELVNAATHFMNSQTARTNEPDPVKMVQAIAAARDAGLTDVEQGFRDKLGLAVLPKEVSVGLGEARCPSCDSTSPRRHPAMQSEGEVQLCANSFHWPNGHPISVPPSVAAAGAQS